MTILVTGANGFIGRRLCTVLKERGFVVIPAVRSPLCAHSIAIGNIGPKTEWRRVLTECPETVVHLAAKSHTIKDVKDDPISAYREINVLGTINFARQASYAGVKRFIFLSSIKVNGENSLPDHPFQVDDKPAPEDLYGISKHEAEQELLSLSRETDMEIVIIRSPLVYGPGVKANFALLIRWLERGLPLPLAAVTCNRRSLVALDNLVDLIVLCVSHPAAGNQTFMVSDGEDLSTADLLNRVNTLLGKPASLLYVPTALLKLGAIALNKPNLYRRLCDSLQVDIKKTRDLLGWSPPLSIDEGLRCFIQKKVYDSFF